jgi:hypothetical protein
MAVQSNSRNDPYFTWMERFWFFDNAFKQQKTKDTGRPFKIRDKLE